MRTTSSAATYTQFWIRERFRHVPEEETRRILGLTAAEVYGVDLEALAPLIDEIGPSVANVHGEVAPADLPTPSPAAA